MHKRLLVLATTGALLLPTGVALADAPETTGPPTPGGDRTSDCIAGTLYGNTSNPSGNGQGVLPSQSPGPSLNTGPNEPPRNDRVDGPSVGDLLQANREGDGNNSGGANAGCDAAQP